MTREELSSQVETLSQIASSEVTIRETLESLEPEIAKAMDHLNSLWSKRREMLGKLAGCEQAKADLVVTKAELAALSPE